MPNTVALIGCGVMGGAIGSRLCEVGETLTVFDIDAARMQALADRGAMTAGSASQAAAESDYVILSLNTADIVRAAVFGPDGVAAGARPGTVVLDMSSIDPPSTQALAADAAQAHLRWVDCPLSGGAPKALIGSLTVMAGGAAEDFEASKAVMDHLCANFTHMGPSGAGLHDAGGGRGHAPLREAPERSEQTGDPQRLPRCDINCTNCTVAMEPP